MGDVSRRAVIGSVWAVPVVMAAAAAPAAAASTTASTVITVASAYQVTDAGGTRYAIVAGEVTRSTNPPIPVADMVVSLVLSPSGDNPTYLTGDSGQFVFVRVVPSRQSTYQLTTDDGTTTGTVSF